MEDDAVPPSSPPHATTARAPDSPFFEPRYSAFSPKSSSPPPVFSSDDSCESVELANYESPRIFKNKRKGAWWDNGDSAHTTPQPKKTRMSRNYDSGVYMMSDNTESSESLLLPQKSPFGIDRTRDAVPEDENNDNSGDEDQYTPRERFNRILNDRLEINHDTYIFSDLDLEDKDIEQIGKLQSVIKNVPDPGNDLPAEGQYRDFVPELYVKLSDNFLRHLTPSLFDAQNITTLILCDNHIQELPAQISKLCNLEELNIARNKLRWLPFDFLKLMQEASGGTFDIMSNNGNPWLMPRAPQILRDASIIPLHDNLKQVLRVSGTPLDLDSLPEMNQLYDAFASKINKEQFIWYMSVCELDASLFNSSDPSDSSPKSKQGHFPHHSAFTRSGDYETREPQHIARTSVSYFDQVGHLQKGSPKPPSSNDDDFSVITATARGAHGVPSSWYTPPSNSGTASLATISLNTAVRRGHNLGLTGSELRDAFVDEDALVPFADRLLAQAQSNSCGGYGEFKKCHVCEKEYIVARAEWIEWWYIHAAEVLPFKVQVCSWGCVPDTMIEQPANVFTWE
ncbi:hypothetical protein DE146DRAFT_631021 [Phaeosphaeria sp. MPI-PUGE-AT-0046c]|nr:hypothetical protein DE146DRAFT_631021 [Phaeosphaeria sp. MPI-PUGE-AT-0046c]